MCYRQPWEAASDHLVLTAAFAVGKRVLTPPLPNSTFPHPLVCPTAAGRSASLTFSPNPASVTYTAEAKESQGYGGTKEQGIKVTVISSPPSIDSTNTTNTNAGL